MMHRVSKILNTKKLKDIKILVFILGVFLKGKGVEQIFRLAKQNQKIFFHIYGEKIFNTEE